MLKQELRPLKARRQGLTDRLFNHPRAGKADQGLGFGDIDIADHPQRGCHPARRRIGHDREIRQSGRPQPVEGRIDLDHLHQGQDALLHAGAARGGKENDRQAFLHRVLDNPGQLLAHHGPHAAARKGKIKQAQGYRPVLNRCYPTHHRLGPTRLGLGIGDTLGIGFAVGKAERVAGRQVNVMLDKRAAVNHQEQTLLNRQPEMHPTFGAHE